MVNKKRIVILSDQDLANNMIFVCKRLIKTKNKENKTMVNNKLQDNDLEKEISNYTFTILPSGKTTVCELILKNGFSVVGVASCLDIRNFDKELGEKCALKDAKRKAFDLVAYSKQTEITNSINDEKKKEREAEKECIRSQRKAATRTISQVIYDAIEENSPLNPTKADLEINPALKKLIADNEAQAYKNIASVLANLSDHNMDFPPDLIFKAGEYTRIAFGYPIMDDTDRLRDVAMFVSYFNNMTTEHQRQFTQLMQNIDRELLMTMKRY